MDLEGYGKKPSKKELNYRKRCFGMTSLDRIQVAHKLKSIGRLQNIALRIGDDSGSDMDEICGDLMILQELIREEIREIEEMDPRMGDPLPRIERKYRTIDSFEETDVRQLFRFESRDQLHRSYQGLYHIKAFNFLWRWCMDIVAINSVRRRFFSVEFIVSTALTRRLAGYVWYGTVSLQFSL